MVAVALALGLALPAVSSAQAPPGAPPSGTIGPGAPPASAHAWRTIKLTDRVYEFIYGGNTSMFVVTPAGVIVTDPIAQRRPDIAQTYLDEIRKITHAPIRYLIYSHSHFSRTEGGRVFKDAGAIVIAQRNARDRLRTVTTPDVVPPDEVVDNFRAIELGGTRLELYYLGRGHSDNMLTMLLPKERILYAVDWLGKGAVRPGGLGGDSWMPEWEAGARKVLRLNWDRMIFGHGPLLATKDDVRQSIAYFDDASAIAKVMAEHDQCTMHEFVAPPNPIPARWKDYTTQTYWDAILDRYCVFWNQGY